MKKVNEILRKYKTAALAAVFVSIGLVGCSPDEKDNDPAPTAPGVNPKLRFVADWSCAEVSHSSPPAQPFQVHCTNSAGDTVLLENFYALGFQHKVKAVIHTDSIIIAPNNQAVSGLVVLNGKGKLINSSKFTMTYHVHDGTAIDTVDATFTK
jgi:hypothetical protein